MILSEINKIKYLFGYKRGVIISEQSNIETPVYYEKCEGGHGLVDPSSFEDYGFDENNNVIIKFISEPKIDYDNGNSKSIGTCLGGDIPLKDRCFNILTYQGKKFVTYEMDCETKKEKY
jgi:hypothetical protein